MPAVPFLECDLRDKLRDPEHERCRFGRDGTHDDTMIGVLSQKAVAQVIDDLIVEIFSCMDSCIRKRKYDKQGPFFWLAPRGATGRTFSLAFSRQS